MCDTPKEHVITQKFKDIQKRTIFTCFIQQRLLFKTLENVLKKNRALLQAAATDNSGFGDLPGVLNVCFMEKI